MALDTVPWMVKGAKHGGVVGRAMAYAATRGMPGVILSGDMLVKPLPTPGSQVRIAAGVAVIPSTYSGQSGQSYVARNDADVDIAITQTSGSARSDMLVLRIDDPEFGGTAPASVENGPYARYAIISNVGSTAETIPGSYGAPAIPLARIDIPAGTGTITGAMIKSLRSVASDSRAGVASFSAPTGNTDRFIAFDTPFPAGMVPTVVVSFGNTNLDWFTGLGARDETNAGFTLRTRQTNGSALPAEVKYRATVSR